MRVTILASGSGGNATLVEAGGARILVDAGVAPASLEARMRFAFGRVVPLDAIVLTHPHGDHAGKAGACARRWDAPVFLTEATARGLSLRGARRRVFGRDAAFDVAGVHVQPTPIPHDAPNVALVFDHDGARAATLTDLGHVPAGLAARLAGCQLVLAESNHCPRMLARGPYPASLKRRIASPTGHLSNAQCAELLRRLGPETREVVLMHLSERCNSPMVALEAARRALGPRRAAATRVRAATQDVPLTLEVQPPRVGRRRRPAEQLGLPF